MQVGSFLPAEVFDPAKVEFLVVASKPNLTEAKF